MLPAVPWQDADAWAHPAPLCAVRRCDDLAAADGALQVADRVGSGAVGAGVALGPVGECAGRSRGGSARRAAIAYSSLAATRLVLAHSPSTPAVQSERAVAVLAPPDPDGGWPVAPGAGSATGPGTAGGDVGEVLGDRAAGGGLTRPGGGAIRGGFGGHGGRSAALRARGSAGGAAGGGAVSAGGGDERGGGGELLVGGSLRRPGGQRGAGLDLRDARAGAAGVAGSGAVGPARPAAVAMMSEPLRRVAVQPASGH